ncbi:MAG: hypothetical protein ACK5JT_19050 [Hyphomicrobiaceae bacterium]
MSTSYSELTPTDVLRSPAVTQDAAVAVLLLLGGALNGLAVRVIDGIETDTLSITLGLSPFQLIAVGVAARLVIVGQGQARRLPIAADVLALALILVPSSSVAWAGVGLYSAVAAMHWTGERRLGALLFLGLAVTSLWSSVLLKWLAAPVTGLEAWMVGQVIHIFRPDIVQSGNVIGNATEHSLVLMTACTTTDAFPIAALALVATVLLLGRVDGRRIGWALLMLGLIYFVGNGLRLIAMAWSGEDYAFWHGPIGRNVFDAAQIAVVLALGNWASRP